MKNNFLLLVKMTLFMMLFITASSVYGQNIEFTKEFFKENKEGLKKAKDNIELGDTYYNQGNIFFKQAIDPYLEANKFNPNNALLNFKIGQCYLYSNFKLKAIPFLEKAKSLNPSVDQTLNFYLGRAYHLDMQWDRAIAEFSVFQKNGNAGGDPEMLATAAKSINECYVGKELSQKPIRVFIDNLGKEVNSQYTDYGPVISADESVLLFTSRRPNTVGGRIDPGLNEYFEDIYISYKQADGKWSSAANMGEPVNTEDHDANSGLSADGTKFLIYIGKNNGDLYESELLGDKWSKPEAMNKNINTDKYHESSAC
jgi:tetratricopeptide (TPR) repeat protein